MGMEELTYLHNEPAGKGRKKEKKNLGINPGQPVGKGREKKRTLVLTLGSPPEKDGKKKKKTLVLTLGRSGAYTANPPEKGGKFFLKKPWY
jgi:hypothetical protein